MQHNSVTPEVRYNAIEEEMRKIGQIDTDCAKFMMEFNVRLKAKRNDVQIGRLELPPIMYGHAKQQEQNEKV